MATAPDWTNITPEEIAGLTDAELVGLSRALDGELARLEAIVRESRGLSTPIARSMFLLHVRHEFRLANLPEPFAEDVDRYLRCSSLRWRVGAEENHRLGEMLRGGRIALGLTLKDVARGAGTRSKVVEEAENGRSPSNGAEIFERACTVGGLEGSNLSLSLSLWRPLADPRICRTIREGAIEPGWLAYAGADVSGLARAISRDGSFDLLPILGDALEEAGCQDAEILGHCRNPGLHARGCWVVDGLIRAGRGDGLAAGQES